MKTFDLSTSFYSLETWKRGQTTSGLRGCQDVNRLYANPANAKGDFTHPLPFSYQRVTSRGLRGLARRLDVATNPSYDFIISSDGPLSSVLDSKGVIYNGVPWDSAYNDAVSNLSSKVRGDIDLSIDLFQWRQTLTTANRILNATQTLKNSFQNMVSGKGPVKEAASLYLEWTYGVAPTLNTLVELLGKIKSRGDVGKALVHCRGRGKVVEQAVVRQQIDPFTYWPITMPFNVDSSYRCQLDVYLTPDQTQWQKISGYTSINPVSWLYEMTPYSFVLDWFWNAGGYMRALETAILHSSRFAYGSDTRSLKQITRPGQYSFSGKNVEFGVTEGAHTFIGMDRFILNSFPAPHLPSFSCSMGARRMLNAAALLSQFLPNMFSNKRGRIRNGLTIPISV